MPGWYSLLNVVGLLLSAQVVISGSWDQAPFRCSACSLLEVSVPSFCAPACACSLARTLSLFLSQKINKSLKTDRNTLEKS